MRKTIISAKLKFVANACDQLSAKIYDDVNRISTPFPACQANEYVEVLKEIRDQARVWTDREIEWMTEHEYEQTVKFIFDRFNKLMAILFPGDMTVI